VLRSGSATGAGVSLFGRGRISIYANHIGASTQFYLARVFPGAAGRSVQLEFWDTGDAEAPGTITVLPPGDATAGGAPLDRFEGCTYSPPPNGSPSNLVPTSSGCSVHGVHRTAWNGQRIVWTIPIPPDYDCAATDPTGCWLRLRFEYPAGRTVNDTTTWEATLGGNPVRLVR
jgi:hypothetical protein